MTGPVDTVPGPVSREGYRILQEALTNVLRHAGAVPVRVRVRVAADTLVLAIRNPLTEPISGPGAAAVCAAYASAPRCSAGWRGPAPTKVTGRSMSSCR
ncbi:hypothetical protein SVIOM74S_10479 [Streptomyces violarus]